MFQLNDVEFTGILTIPSLLIDRQTTLITGPSGGGKTTLLRLLNKLISPTHGVILYNDKDLAGIPTVEHRRRVMMLSQQAIVFDGNVRDNLQIGFRYQERSAPDDATLSRALEQVQLPKPLDDDTQRFSGGEKQRLALARVLLLAPDVFLLDEPAASLDDDTEERILETLSAHVKQTGQQIIMVTHARQMAEPMADAVVIIENGRVADVRRTQ